MRESIQSLIQLLKTHSAQVFELEDELYELTCWLEKYWEWRDWCALAPMDPDEPHPMQQPEPWQTSAPSNPYHPYSLDEELPL